MSQTRAPLFEALQRYRAVVKAPMHVPGHKMGRGAADDWRSFLGEGTLAIDQTEAPGLDDLHAPSGPILEAQQLAAAAFGAERTFFLVGGTTAGLHALILTACRPGERLAVPRNAHRSVLGALILAGVQPVWMPVPLDPELGMATHPAPAALAAALDGVSAVLLLHPNYYGQTGNLAASIAMAHQRGLPVLVDEAHGTHFGFHPALPPSALSLGADGVAQSMHKTGGSLTQSSLCHLGRGGRLSATRLADMLRLVQSTSPSYLLMASLDMARRQLALHGAVLWGQTLELAQEAVNRLSGLPGIRVLPTDDPTKLLIDVRGRGLTGMQAMDALWAGGVAVETAGLGYVLAVLSPGDSKESVESLVKAVSELPYGPGTPGSPPEPPWPEPVMLPREAYLGDWDLVPLSTAVGRIAAEMVAPYPPGIPVVIPGERLTTEVVQYLQTIAAFQFHLQGVHDPRLHSIRVVRE